MTQAKKMFEIIVEKEGHRSSLDWRDSAHCSRMYLAHKARGVYALYYAGHLLNNRDECGERDLDFDSEAVYCQEGCLNRAMTIPTWCLCPAGRLYIKVCF